MEQEGNSKIKNQAIFDQSKNYSQQLKTQLETGRRELNTIEAKNQRLRSAVADQSNRQDELDVLTQECNKFEETIRRVTAEPFLQ